MNSKSEADIPNIRVPLNDNSFNKDCSQNIYEELDPRKVILLPNSDYATQAWYSGQD